jgi:hypothetical protein
MSQQAPQTSKERPPTSGGVGRGGPMAGMMGGPAQKSKDFKGSLGRLLGEVGEERKTLYAVFLLITTSVTIGSFGPKILGHATNQIFTGFLGHKLPAGSTKEQVVAGLRAKGENSLADVVNKSGVIPGRGIDFTVVAHWIFLAIVLYIIS